MRARNSSQQLISRLGSYSLELHCSQGTFVSLIYCFMSQEVRQCLRNKWLRYRARQMPRRSRAPSSSGGALGVPPALAHGPGPACGCGPCHCGGKGSSNGGRGSLPVPLTADVCGGCRCAWRCGTCGQSGTGMGADGGLGLQTLGLGLNGMKLGLQNATRNNNTSAHQFECRCSERQPSATPSDSKRSSVYTRLFSLFNSSEVRIRAL